MRAHPSDALLSVAHLQIVPGENGGEGCAACGPGAGPHLTHDGLVHRLERAAEHGVGAAPPPTRTVRGPHQTSCNRTSMLVSCRCYDKRRSPLVGGGMLRSHRATSQVRAGPQEAEKLKPQGVLPGWIPRHITTANRYAAPTQVGAHLSRSSSAAISCSNRTGRSAWNRTATPSNHRYVQTLENKPPANYKAAPMVAATGTSETPSSVSSSPPSDALTTLSP